ncbi:MAG: DUF4469 domain-containing protein [Treponema sp.]|nr:DUF4469 domain-containing protein [Treponema sp.]
MIEYSLIKNVLTGDPNKYRALVMNSRSYTFDDIAKHLIKHNTGLSSSAIYGLWEGIKGAVEEFTSEGGIINTELFQTSVSIKGSFNGANDGFDSSRHKLRLNLRPGPLLKNVPGKLKVRKLNPGLKSFIVSVTDVKTGSVNSSLTPGKNVRITGQRVKIMGDDPSCGLYFIPEKPQNDPVKVEVSDYVVNNPSELIAVIPKLGKGNWKLKLVTQFCPGPKLRKDAQSVTFEKDLTVA